MSETGVSGKGSDVSQSCDQITRTPCDDDDGTIPSMFC